MRCEKADSDSLLPLGRPSQFNDLLTQIHRANMSVVYRRRGRRSGPEFRLCLQLSVYYS